MDATFWAFVALLLFLALVVYLGVPAMATSALDKRADTIRNDLEEARRLREEAQELLAQYQRQRKDAEREAEDIVAAAKREAKALSEEAERKTTDYVARRTKLAEQKIAQAEAQALAEVKASAVDTAVAAAQRIIAERTSGAAATSLFKKSLAEVKARMN